MAGRGRGGGGGRGRGRASLSFTVDQLGFGAGEALPGPVLQPPPTYPPLESHPVALQTGPEVEYMWALKKELVEFLRDSPAYILPAVAKADIERYSDKYQVALANKPHTEVKFDWSRFPKELRPSESGKVNKKRKKAQTKLKPKKKAVDITNRLEELEKKEEKGSDEEVGEAEKEKEEEEEKENAEEGDEEVEEEELDEEMDEGTDYINSYFDNGESYIDDDEDALSDGPTY